MYYYLSFAFASLPYLVTSSTEPNPPTWPSSVAIFSSTMSSSEILNIVNEAFSNNGGDPRTSCSHG